METRGVGITRKRVKNKDGVGLFSVKFSVSLISQRYWTELLARIQRQLFRRIRESVEMGFHVLQVFICRCFVASKKEWMCALLAYGRRVVMVLLMPVELDPSPPLGLQSLRYLRKVARSLQSHQSPPALPALTVDAWLRQDE